MSLQNRFGLFAFLYVLSLATQYQLSPANENNPDVFNGNQEVTSIGSPQSNVVERIRVRNSNGEKLRK